MILLIIITSLFWIVMGGYFFFYWDDRHRANLEIMEVQAGIHRHDLDMEKAKNLRLHRRVSYLSRRLVENMRAMEEYLRGGDMPARPVIKSGEFGDSIDDWNEALEDLVEGNQ